MSLEYLLKALCASATALTTKSSPKVSVQQVDKIAMFCVDLMAHICFKNSFRLNTIWMQVMNYLSSIVEPATVTSPLVEKCVLVLLVLFITAVKNNDTNDQMFESLQILLKLKAKVAEAMAKRVSIGINKIIDTNPLIIKYPHFTSCS